LWFIDSSLIDFHSGHPDMAPSLAGKYDQIKVSMNLRFSIRPLGLHNCTISQKDGGRK